MCGIVGVFGRIGLPEEKMLLDLLMVDTVRGTDSTGLAAIRHDGSTLVQKELGLLDKLLDKPQAKDLFKGVHRGYIGHNRAATKGKVTRKNAHPFVQGHIVGVHNGTLTSEDGLLNAWKFGTDSQAVFDHIENQGIEDCWKNLNGPATLVWWDAKRKTYNFIRNARRPLHFAYSEDGHTLFIASEEWMLLACAGRRIGIKIGEVRTPRVDDHFVFEYDIKEGVIQSGGPLTPWKAPAVKPYTPPTSRSTDVWQNGAWVPKDEGEGEQRLPLATGNGGPSGCLDGSSIEDMLLKNITPKRFHKIYKECTFCRESLMQEYAESVILDDFNAACGMCVDLAELNGVQLIGGM